MINDILNPNQIAVDALFALSATQKFNHTATYISSQILQISVDYFTSLKKNETSPKYQENHQRIFRKQENLIYP